MEVLIASFFIGLVAAVFSSLVGGAAGQIMVPLLLFLGLPPYTALSTPKMGAVGITIGSAYKFSSTKLTNWKLVPILLLLAVFAGVAGANLLLQIPENALSKIVAILLIISVVALNSKNDLGIVNTTTSATKKAFGYVAYFFSEMSRAAVGSGFGMLTGITLTYFFGLTMLESTATKRIAGIVVSVVALATFLFQGVIDLPVGFVLFGGCLIGSYIGTHYAIILGDRWVKYLFTVFAIIMSILLLII